MRLTVAGLGYVGLTTAIFTNAPEFKKADLKLVSSRVKVIFNGRNLFEPTDLGQFGIEYHPIGRKFCGNP